MKLATLARFVVAAAFVGGGIYGAASSASADPADGACSSSFTSSGSPLTAYTGGPLTISVDCAAGTQYGPAGANDSPPQQIANTWWDPDGNEYDASINAGPQPFGAPDGTGSIAWTSYGFTSSQSYTTDPFGYCSTGSPCDLTNVKWTNGGNDGSATYTRWNGDGSFLYSSSINSDGTWDTAPASASSTDGIGGAFDSARDSLVSYVTTGIASLVVVLMLGLGVVVLIRYTRKAARVA